MVSSTTNTSNTLMDPAGLGSTPASSGTTTADSTSSFTQQLLTALESFLGQSGSGSNISITDEGQNSGSSQFLVTLTGPAASTVTGSESPAAAPVAASTGTFAAAAASVAETVAAGGMAVTGLQDQIQALQSSWASLTPAQVAYQLANAAGTGGGMPTATVPGTTLTFGDLNQVQQLAYQYGSDYGTGSVSMQDFLTQNAGPDLPWNLSYNQIQANPYIQAAADASYQSAVSSMPANEYATPPPTSGNADNLPNPALIQYLPQDEQAAAYAAVSAEGMYGQNVAAAAQAYAQAQSLT